MRGVAALRALVEIGYGSLTVADVRSADFYSTLLENSFEGTAIVDGSGRITFQNRAAAHILGASVGELIGKSAMDLIHPDDLAEAGAVLASLNTNVNILLPNEVRMQRQDDGRYVHLRVRAVNLGEHPEVRGIVVNFRDVSAEVSTLEALSESEQRLELAVEGSGLGLFDWDIAAERILYDGRLARILGLDAIESGRDTIRALVHPDDLPALDDALSAHFEGATEYFEHEHRLLAAGGQYKWVTARGKVVARGPTGKPLRMVGTHLDVDQRRRDSEDRSRLEEQLQIAQKMESIGQLAGGIAHDFNNILQVVLANARFASLELGNQSAVLEALREIEVAGERAAQLTAQLLAFGRRQTISPSAQDLNGLIRNNLKLLRRVLPENITVDFIPGHRLAPAFVDPGQFDQVVTNLCVNARDAMPEGGRLTIETESVVINGEYRQQHPWARSGRYILVTVSDTGMGMDGETQRRAFEPFFTTKGDGIGSGLGLAMVHGIVRQHDGLVHLYSEIGVGSTFKLYWPAAERPAEVVGRKIEGAVPRGKETVLVVEDETAVRRLVGRILESAGYSVMSAEDGEEAIQVFFAHRERIHLVLLDAVMPKRNGREVYEIISRHHPLPVLFTSGYSAASLPADFLARDQLDVLPKPYAPDLLLRKVREVIDGWPRRSPPRAPLGGRRDDDT